MKVLLIESCNECPFFKAYPIQNSDNECEVECSNPDRIGGVAKWTTKIRNTNAIMSGCPLEEDWQFKNEE